MGPLLALLVPKRMLFRRFCYACFGAVLSLERDYFEDTNKIIQWQIKWHLKILYLKSRDGSKQRDTAVRPKASRVQSTHLVGTQTRHSKMSLLTVYTIPLASAALKQAIRALTGLHLTCVSWETTILGRQVVDELQSRHLGRHAVTNLSPAPPSDAPVSSSVFWSMCLRFQKPERSKQKISNAPVQRAIAANAKLKTHLLN